MTKNRRRLADRLKLLRQEAGLSGNRLAKTLGWVQPKISKLETAKQLPTEEDILQWTSALNSSPKAVEDLFALLKQARVEYASWKEQYREAGSASGKQSEFMTLEQRATRIADFQPAMIPGLVQTVSYAQESLRLSCGPSLWGSDEPDIQRMVSARLQRQQVLYDPAKQVQVIVLEAALQTRVCSVDTLIGQLDRLIAMQALPSLELGIIAFDAVVPIFPLTGFAIFDHDLVIVETLGGDHEFRDPEEVANYDQFWQLLSSAAVYDEAATAVLQRNMKALQLPKE